MPRFVPPAAAPVPASVLFGALKSVLLQHGGREELFPIGQRLEVRHIIGTSSGRAALSLILTSLRRLCPDRNAVAVPAYTCFSVAAAVVRAGLKLYPVDVDADTGDIDISRLEAVPEAELLCIVSCNLFGFVSDVSSIGAVARAKGAFHVDDAAQAMGARRGGHWAGTQGDVGLYSLARGKALSCIEGGLIVTNRDDVAEAIARELSTWPDPSWLHLSSLFLKNLATSIFLRPSLYWIPNSLPFLKLGVTEFEPAFPATHMTSLGQALVARLVAGLEQANQARRRNAMALAPALGNCRGLRIMAPAGDCIPTYVRFPLVAQDRATRDRALRDLRQAGFGASPFYPSALCDIPGIERHWPERASHCRQAEELSQRLLTLPCHLHVQPRDIDRMASILTRIAA